MYYYQQYFGNIKKDLAGINVDIAKGVKFMLLVLRIYM